MSNLTSKQSLEMAKYLTALQTLIGSYKHVNAQKLTDEESIRFRKTLKLLSDAAGILNAQTVTIALSEADDAIGNLNNAINKINDVLQTIDKLQIWINISAAAFNLATALINNNPVDIGKGVVGMVKSTNDRTYQGKPL